MSEHKFRCGDTARIKGTDYDIEVAYADYGSGRASWFGWPEGDVELCKLDLVKACSDEEHRASVAQWLDMPRSSESDHRRERIEKLYRPVAYWKRMRSEYRARVENELAVLRSVEAELLRALDGPADVEPLPPVPVSSEKRGAPSA